MEEKKKWPKRDSTKARGYGVAHQRLRKKLLPFAYGTPCPRCGKEMQVGEQLHLGHSDDRKTYTGMEHATCNMKAGRELGVKRQYENANRIHAEVKSDTSEALVDKTLRVRVTDL